MDTIWKRYQVPANCAFCWPKDLAVFILLRHLIYQHNRRHEKRYQWMHQTVWEHTIWFISDLVRDEHGKYMPTWPTNSRAKALELDIGVSGVRNVQECLTYGGPIGVTIKLLQHFHSHRCTMDFDFNLSSNRAFTPCSGGLQFLTGTIRWQFLYILLLFIVLP